MIQPTVGFIVYGVHKDGLKDPMGTPFIDDAIVKRSKAALKQAGMKVIEHDVVIASKDEARSALKKMKTDDRVDMIVLFSGTWVWRRIWSRPYVTTRPPARQSCCGRTLARKAGARLADW